jgi:hypothetical protein
MMEKRSRQLTEYLQTTGQIPAGNLLVSYKLSKLFCDFAKFLHV